MMDEKLKTLVTLAKIKNYTKTAKILSITQPAVTQHIQALENEYGIKIFEKNKKELIPTLQGAILIENAHKIMQLHENLLSELKESKTHLKNISIGITMTATDYLIEDILEICNQIYPNCSINFHTDILTNIYNRLKMYEFDFAIVDGTSSSKKIGSYLLYDDHFCLITSIEHPFASLKSVTLEMIRQFYFDHAFLSTNGVDLETKEVYVFDFKVGAVKKEIMSRCKRTDLLIDASKFETRAMCTWANLDDFHTVYTDSIKEGIEPLENFVICEKE